MAIASGAAAGGVVVTHLGAGAIPVFFIISAALTLILFWLNMRNN